MRDVHHVRVRVSSEIMRVYFVDHRVTSDCKQSLVRQSWKAAKDQFPRTQCRILSGRV